MTDAIGRGDYVLGADFEGVEKGVAAAEETIKQSAADAEKAYAAAGQKAATGFATALRVGMKVVAGAASAAFAIATKGALELENATADFRAETGATAEEAKRAGEAINAMSGRNLAGIAQIGVALSKVHTDLGLVGEEAERTTERFLRFARATKQDAAAAVMAFDDILDAWGLEASASGRIMDLLVASHQKYGGSIEANQAALAKLAPALKAANLQIDDGQALLNLFASSGMDAAEAPQALQKALATIKSPAERTLIDDISRTEDPFLRAQKAADLFGIRAGAKLANALAGSNLDDYRLSLDEVAGASDRAADALDSTFSAQLQLALKAIGSRLNEVALATGPLITGLASAATGAAALGLNVAGAIPALRNFISTLGAVRVAIAATGLGALALAILAVAQAASDSRPEVEKLRELLNYKDLFGQGLPEQVKADIVRRISEIEVAQSVQLQATQEWAVGMRDAFVRSGIPDAVRGVTAAMAAEVAAGRAELQVGADGLTSVIPKSLEAARTAAVAIARKTPGEIAAALREKRAAWRSAVDQLGSDLENEMSRAAEIALIKAELAGDNLQRGLKSKDPIVRAQAEATTQILLTELATLQGQAKTYGSNTGNAYADGIIAGLKERIAETRRAVGIYRNLFVAFSPPGPESPLHLIDVWGRKTGEAWAESLATGVRGVRSAVFDAIATLQPALVPASIVSTMVTSASMTVRVEHHLTADGARNARAAGFDERRLAGALQQGVDASGFITNLQQRAARTSG